MAECGGPVGQGQGTRTAIQGDDHEDGAADHRRGDRAVPEKREEVIVYMAAGLLGAYRYFLSRRGTHAGSASSREPKGNAAKVGRNDPCPCGSGKKYKKCCGGATVN
jgi:uncharacterized protein